MRVFGKVRAKDPSFEILDNKDKARSFALKLTAMLVQRSQARAVLLETVDKMPIVHDAQTLRNHSANLLRHSAGQQLCRRGRALAITMEDEGIKRRRTQGTGCAAHGGKDTVYTVLAVVIMVLEVVLVVGGVGLAGKGTFAGEATDEAGPHIGDIRGRSAIRVVGRTSAGRVGGFGGVVAVRRAHNDLTIDGLKLLCDAGN